MTLHSCVDLGRKRRHERGESVQKHTTMLTMSDGSYAERARSRVVMNLPSLRSRPSQEQQFVPSSCFPYIDV